MTLCILLGCALGVLAGGASLVAGFGWWVAIGVYFGFGTLGLLAGAVFEGLRRRAPRD